MFSIVVDNILKRYSRDDLSKRYSVNLPSKEENFEILKKVNNSNKIDGNYYELSNTNKFVKQKGERAHASILKEERAIFFEYRLSWLEKLILMIITFFNNLRQKTIDFFNTLISKIPNNLKILANILTFILYIPITILGIFSMIILTISSAFKFRLPGNIGGIFGTVIGVIIGLILSIFVVAIKFIFELIGLLLLPFLNKFSDSIIDKPYIRKMVIGNFMDNGKFDEGIVLSKNMVNTLDFEVKKNLLGKESLYVVINEGFEKMSLTDRILNLFLPNYFVNKKTIFVTDKSNKESFENLFKN